MSGPSDKPCEGAVDLNDVFQRPMTAVLFARMITRSLVEMSLHDMGLPVEVTSAANMNTQDRIARFICEPETLPAGARRSIEDYLTFKAPERPAQEAGYGPYDLQNSPRANSLPTKAPRPLLPHLMVGPNLTSPNPNNTYANTYSLPTQYNHNRTLNNPPLMLPRLHPSKATNLSSPANLQFRTYSPASAPCSRTSTTHSTPTPTQEHFDVMEVGDDFTSAEASQRRPSISAQSSRSMSISAAHFSPSTQNRSRHSQPLHQNIQPKTPVEFGPMTVKMAVPKKRKARDAGEETAPKKPRVKRNPNPKMPKVVKEKKAEPEKNLESAKYKLGDHLWMRVLEFTPPNFLLKARLINKTFASYVDDFRSIYRNNRRENFGYDMPDPPSGFSEKAYNNLLGAKGCMEDGCTDKNASRTHWPWMKRWCLNHWKEKIERADRVTRQHQSRFDRQTIEKLLLCIPSGYHDPFIKPHDYIDASAVRPATAPRLYKYHVLADVDRIIERYEALTPKLDEDPAWTAAEKATALADHQLLLDRLDEKRSDFLAVGKAKNDEKMDFVVKIENCIRNRRISTRKPNDANRAARKKLFSGLAVKELKNIPLEFVVETIAFKAATRIFRDAGTERGWRELKPKIVKEHEKHLEKAAAEKEKQKEQEKIKEQASALETLATAAESQNHGYGNNQGGRNGEGHPHNSSDLYQYSTSNFGPQPQANTRPGHSFQSVSRPMQPYSGPQYARSFNSFQNGNGFTNAASQPSYPYTQSFNTSNVRSGSGVGGNMSSSSLGRPVGGGNHQNNHHYMYGMVPVPTYATPLHQPSSHASNHNMGSHNMGTYSPGTNLLRNNAMIAGATASGTSSDGTRTQITINSLLD